MGSLKKKKQGLGEDRQPCDITNNEGISGLDDTAATEECQEPTTLEDCQPKLHVDASYVDNTEKTLKSKDQGPSVGFCESSDPSVSEPLKDCAQPVNLQTVVMQNEAMVSTNIRGKGDDEGENIALDKGKGKDLENIFVPVPTTPGPSDPRSPTPFGQQHMRTQVSLEVVQCCSAATSPMTPPEGEHSFFFPSTFGKQGTGPADSAASTKDAKLHIGQQVDFCSVATSPMTPKTPSYTAFPALVGKGMGQQEEKMKNKADQIARDEKGRCTTSKCLGEVSQKDEYLKCASSNEMSKGSSSNRSVGSSTGGLTTAVTQAQVTVEDRVQQCKQQRMGSMDQDITILVTQHGNNEDAGEEKDETLEVEMVKIEEIKKARENTRNIETVEKITSTVALDHAQEKSSPKQPQKRPENPNVCNKADNSEAIAQNNVQLELTDVSLPKSPVPESPAPFGCHNIRTQVSLEVVQCQSVATSPMTPPEGTQAFYFPIFLGKCKDMGTETKDTELQVGQQVEFRSVATAPMTPRTPVATTFPEIQKQVSIEEKIQEEREEENKERVIENKKEILKEEEKLTQKESVKEDGKEVVNCNEKDEEKGEEPVTEVSWDEKGMTWEVYGAVVEVAVLGSAIQKHLEKQVKKQKQLSSMPPPPPLSPSASPLTSEPSCGGSGKRRGRKKGEHDGKVIRRRRNPFRLLMENVQQPHCCSKANTTE